MTDHNNAPKTTGVPTGSFDGRLSEAALAFNPESFDAYKRVLAPHEQLILHHGTTLIDPREIEEATGIYAAVPAMVAFGGTRLMVMDIRMHAKDEDGNRAITKKTDTMMPFRVNADFMIVDTRQGAFDPYAGEGYKGVRTGEKAVPFGRAAPQTKNRFVFDNAVADKHLEIGTVARGGLFITDLGSRPTEVTLPGHRVSNGNTVLVLDRMAGSSLFDQADELAPYGYYNGYRILGKHASLIDGGVYLGGTAREAIVVDSTKDPVLSRAYDEFLSKRVVGKLVDRLVRKEAADPITAELVRVNEFVRSKMRYDGNAVTDLVQNYYGDQLILLGEFIKRGIGICRHQGPFAAGVIEQLINAGRLQGSVRVQRNTIPEFGGTHGWASFIDPTGKEYVVDPAQGFAGTKQDAIKTAGRWDYYLPVE